MPASGGKARQMVRTAASALALLLVARGRQVQHGEAMGHEMRRDGDGLLRHARLHVQIIDEGIGAEVDAVAEFLAQTPRGQRHADGGGQPVPGRLHRQVQPARLGATGTHGGVGDLLVLLLAIVSLAPQQVQQGANGRMKITGNDETVAPRPLRRLHVMHQIAREQHRQHRRDRVQELAARFG